MTAYDTEVGSMASTLIYKIHEMQKWQPPEDLRVKFTFNPQKLKMPVNVVDGKYDDVHNFKYERSLDRLGMVEASRCSVKIGTNWHQYVTLWRIRRYKFNLKVDYSNDIHESDLSLLESTSVVPNIRIINEMMHLSVGDHIIMMVGRSEEDTNRRYLVLCHDYNPFVDSTRLLPNKIRDMIEQSRQSMMEDIAIMEDVINETYVMEDQLATNIEEAQQYDDEMRYKLNENILKRLEEGSDDDDGDEDFFEMLDEDQKTNDSMNDYSFSDFSSSDSDGAEYESESDGETAYSRRSVVSSTISTHRSYSDRTLVFNKRAHQIQTVRLRGALKDTISKWSNESYEKGIIFTFPYEFSRNMNIKRIYENTFIHNAIGVDGIFIDYGKKMDGQRICQSMMNLVDAIENMPAVSRLMQQRRLVKSIESSSSLNTKLRESLD
jgi:hypothetical protein